LPYTEVLARLNDVLHFPSGSYVRLQMSREDAAYHSLRELKSKYPQFNIGTKVIETGTYVPDGPDLIERPVIVAIRPDTIQDLLKARIGLLPGELSKEVDKILAEC